jgi:hypothetical protein
MADQYGTPPIPREQQLPDRPSLRLLLARYLPEMLGGGDFSRGEDERLPMEADSVRDPRLPPRGFLDAARETSEQVQDIGRPPMRQDVRQRPVSMQELQQRRAGAPAR